MIFSTRQMPLFVALVLVGVAGVWLLARADGQARDTIRKHHLADIEASLYFAKSLRGTYPPYDQATWCGQINDPKNASVRAEVEAALRQQNEQYKNLAKPFMTDPVAGHDYFYWKRSPAMFELYSMLEADQTSERNSFDCPNAAPAYYDYGTASIWREGQIQLSL